MVAPPDARAGARATHAAGRGCVPPCRHELAPQWSLLLAGCAQHCTQPVCFFIGQLCHARDASNRRRPSSSAQQHTTQTLLHTFVRCCVDVRAPHSWPRAGTSLRQRATRETQNAATSPQPHSCCPGYMQASVEPRAQIEGWRAAQPHATLLLLPGRLRLTPCQPQTPPQPAPRAAAATLRRRTRQPCAP
jgi:hypothetical protein